MIGIIFFRGSEILEVRIVGNILLFRNSETNNNFYPIDSLKLDRQGVLNEFPDLKDNANWRTEAISRFKSKMKEFPTEKEASDYVIGDLKKYGYTPKYLQQQGFRVVKL
jgi:hypothetical protein